jgi:hypothetical protein
LAAHFAKRNTKFGIGGHKVAAGMNLKGLLKPRKK